MGVLKASGPVPRGTEIEKTSPGIESYRSPSCMN